MKLWVLIDEIIQGAIAADYPGFGKVNPMLRPLGAEAGVLDVFFMQQFPDRICYRQSFQMEWVYHHSDISGNGEHSKMECKSGSKM